MLKNEVRWIFFFKFFEATSFYEAAGAVFKIDSRLKPNNNNHSLSKSVKRFVTTEINK